MLAAGSHHLPSRRTRDDLEHDPYAGIASELPPVDSGERNNLSDWVVNDLSTLADAVVQLVRGAVIATVE